DWYYRIGRVTWKKVEYSQAVFKPRIAPGRQHRPCFFFIKSRGDQHRFKLTAKGVYRLAGRVPVKHLLAANQVLNLISRSPGVVFEKNNSGARFRAFDFHLHGVPLKPDRRRQPAGADSPVEEEFLYLLASSGSHAKQVGIGRPGRVVPALLLLVVKRKISRGFGDD